MHFTPSLIGFEGDEPFLWKGLPILMGFIGAVNSILQELFQPPLPGQVRR
jgi:hypothetical protein